jgi:hypothetical protein
MEGTRELLRGSEKICLLFAVSLSVFLTGCAVNSRPARFGTALESFFRIPADGLYGQADYSSNPALPLSIVDPRQLVIANGKLFAADYNLQRVLIWNQIPNSMHVPPDVVIGQPNPGS